MFEQIDQYLNTCSTLTESERSYFHSLLTFKKLKKKTMLLKAGDVCNFEGFINKGCARVFYINEKGAEVILHFAIENWWVSDITSFSQQIPSKLYIEILEDSDILMIDFKQRKTL
jgi:CRP-like cAMP-binding protein